MQEKKLFIRFYAYGKKILTPLLIDFPVFTALYACITFLRMGK